MERLSGNTKNRLFTRSWTARVRLFHPAAGAVVAFLVFFVLCSHPSWVLTVSEDIAESVDLLRHIIPIRLTYYDTSFDGTCSKRQKLKSETKKVLKWSQLRSYYS